MGLESVTLIPIIDRLESDGLVERRVYKIDRRNNRIYRTQTVYTRTKPLIVISGFYNLLKLIFQRQEVESAGVLEKMWIKLRLNFDNADVNNSTTLKATSSSSKVKVTLLVSATGLDPANQK